MVEAGGSSPCATALPLTDGAPTSMTLTSSGRGPVDHCPSSSGSYVSLSLPLSRPFSLPLPLPLSFTPSLLLSFPPALPPSRSPSPLPSSPPAPSRILLLLVIMRRVTWMRPSSCTTRSLRTTPRTSGPTYARWDTKGGSGNLLCHRE